MAKKRVKIGIVMSNISRENNITVSNEEIKSMKENGSVHYPEN